MAKEKKSSETPSKPSSKRRLRPTLNPETRESQLISLATDLAAQQLMDGTASAQVITHYLKLGTTKAKLEREKLEKENALLKAKTEALESQKNVEKLYADALFAMRRYNGFSEEVDEEEDDYYYEED